MNNTKEKTEMIKELQYETVLIRMVMALIAAIAVVMGLILLMGIQFATCNPGVLLFGVITVGVLFWICASI